jgi:hypothetical protein
MHIATTCGIGRPLRGLLVGVLVCSLVSIPAAAEASWLDRAKDLLDGAQSGAPKAEALSEQEIGDGLKDALRVGTETVVARLAKKDGFNADPSIHIPLPSALEDVKSTLDKFGMGSMLNDLELRLNRAAEEATPRARNLLLKAISDMTLDDVMAIYNGSDDAATRYFQSKMSDSLAAEMRPVVDESLADVGAIQAHDSVMGRYNAVPFVPKVETDLTGYVVQEGMDGIFHYLAQEEAAIRKDPVKRTTDLLQRVFSN